eukprot:jgi/Hompol1/1948/HPOL_005791-RA
MKKIVLEKGGIKRLVQLLDSMENVLRLNAIWALKNMAFQTDSDTKNALMEQLGWHKLQLLMDDESLAIQEQALNLLRNLACGKEKDVEAVFTGFHNVDLLKMLETKLLMMQDHPEILIQVYWNCL